MDIETSNIARVTACIVPFLIRCHFVADPDQASVGFSASFLVARTA